mmetsp:Transcript_30524/g.65502  ORF Transcript_30524/g.65502 Transcript_30524/m.65502 type:complete len:206 (-) Transcript_30524:450-1067(-)
MTTSAERRCSRCLVLVSLSLSLSSSPGRSQSKYSTRMFFSAGCLVDSLSAATTAPDKTMFFESTLDRTLVSSCFRSDSSLSVRVTVQDGNRSGCCDSAAAKAIPDRPTAPLPNSRTRNEPSLFLFLLLLSLLLQRPVGSATKPPKMLRSSVASPPETIRLVSNALEYQAWSPTGDHMPSSETSGASSKQTEEFGRWYFVIRPPLA